MAVMHQARAIGVCNSVQLEDDLSGFTPVGPFVVSIK